MRLTVNRYIGGSRKRLAKAIGKKPDNVGNWQAHHIIPYLEFDNTVSGQQCKRILEKAGIGINDRVNGVWMEKNFHTRALHSEEYIKAIYKRLNSAEIFAQANKPGDLAFLQQQVRGTLSEVKQILTDTKVFP